MHAQAPLLDQNAAFGSYSQQKHTRAHDPRWQSPTFFGRARARVYGEAKGMHISALRSQLHERELSHAELEVRCDDAMPCQR